MLFVVNVSGLFHVQVMFYFVNYPDFDIKRYTWSIITTTISVFTAVLTFQASGGGDWRSWWATKKWLNHLL